MLKSFLNAQKEHEARNVVVAPDGSTVRYNAWNTFFSFYVSDFFGCRQKNRYCIDEMLGFDLDVTSRFDVVGQYIWGDFVTQINNYSDYVIFVSIPRILKNRMNFDMMDYVYKTHGGLDAMYLKIYYLNRQVLKYAKDTDQEYTPETARQIWLDYIYLTLKDDPEFVNSIPNFFSGSGGGNTGDAKPRFGVTTSAKVAPVVLILIFIYYFYD